MPSFRNELHVNDSEVALALDGEERRQQDGVELIPSENYTYPEVLELLGSVFTNKYSEGYPGRRYYGGQEFTNQSEHANVQPLSGSPMNQAVYLGLLKPGDTILAMDLSHGGHLTHGAPVSHMGQLFNFARYKTHPSRGGAIDFDELRATARHVRPKLVLCGYSSYPRDLDYTSFKSIADEVGALTMADVSHCGGLIAGKVLRNPLDAGFDIMTTTSYKTLRGPRGGIILCRRELAGKIDASVFPGLQGGPHMNVVAANASLSMTSQRLFNCAMSAAEDVSPAARASASRLSRTAFQAVAASAVVAPSAAVAPSAVEKGGRERSCSRLHHQSAIRGERLAKEWPSLSRSRRER
jgi:glycine hydroxymethyltransferase